MHPGNRSVEPALPGPQGHARSMVAPLGCSVSFSACCRSAAQHEAL